MNYYYDVLISSGLRVYEIHFVLSELGRIRMHIYIVCIYTELTMNVVMFESVISLWMAPIEYVVISK